MPYRQRRSVGERLNAVIERKYGLDPVQTGKITENLYVVNTDTVDFYIYRGGGYAICFDTGYRPRVIRRELSKLDVDPDGVTHVFLSHADLDHTIGLRVFKNAAVYLSADEVQMISGFRSPRRAVRSPRIPREYRLLRDNDVVTAGAPASGRLRRQPYAAQWPILWTIHTFIWRYLQAQRRTGYAGKHYTMDYETQKDSIRKLARLQNIEWVLTAHSGYTRILNALLLVEIMLRTKLKLNILC